MAQLVIPQVLILQQRGAGQLVAAAVPLPSPSCLSHKRLLGSLPSSSSSWRCVLPWYKRSAVMRNNRGKMVIRMSNSGRSGGSKTISSDRGSLPPASTAKEAIESGLSLFSKVVPAGVLVPRIIQLITQVIRMGALPLNSTPASDLTPKVKDALDQFDAAMKLSPEPEEAQAALYNKACCHAYREEGEKAAKALRQALGDYGLKFNVILNDPDMAPFRAMPEFKQLQDEARKGGDQVGQSFRRDLKLISEVQAPFRGVRRFFYVAFILAAGLSTLFTLPRLVAALQGGEGAPTVLGTSQNLAINLGGIAVFVGLFIWDNKKEEEQISRISRDETLSRLPLRLQSNRVTELSQIRETTRPVIVAGKREAVTKAMQQAQRSRDELIKRGVVVIPIVWSSETIEPVKKRGFGSVEKPLPQTSPAPVGDDFEKRAADVAAKAVIQAERRFKAEAVSPVEWERWIRDQQESEGVTPGTDVFIVLRLDGRIRKSGRGMPDWQDLINELPPLDALISKLEK